MTMWSLPPPLQNSSGISLTPVDEAGPTSLQEGQRNQVRGTGSEEPGQRNHSKTSLFASKQLLICYDRLILYSGHVIVM